MASLSFTQPLEHALILAKEVSPCTFLSISLFRKSFSQQVVLGINKRGLNLFQPSERLKKAGMLLAGNEPGNQRFPDCTLYPLYTTSAILKPLIKRFLAYTEFSRSSCRQQKMRLNAANSRGRPLPRCFSLLCTAFFVLHHICPYCF